MSARLIDIKQAILVGLFATSMLLTAQVQAHGGLALAEDMCVLTVGPYRMHFTGYQPLSQEEEFCEDIPEVGKTVIALDYIQEELRPLKTEVRIIRDTGSEENLDANSDSDSIIYSDESENDDDIEGDSAFEADTYAGLPDQNSLKKSKNTTESPLHHTTYRAQSQKRKEEETGILSTIKEERGGDDEDESYEESDDSESSDEGSSDSEVID